METGWSLIWELVWHYGTICLPQNTRYFADVRWFSWRIKTSVWKRLLSTWFAFHSCYQSRFNKLLATFQQPFLSFCFLCYIYSSRLGGDVVTHLPLTTTALVRLWLWVACGMSFILNSQRLVVFPSGLYFTLRRAWNCSTYNHPIRLTGLARTCSAWCKNNGFTFAFTHKFGGKCYFIY